MISNPTAPNPNKLMAQLRMMPDQQLLQYAQMHKNDPYIFPMAFQESNTRKQMRAAQAPQAGQAPKVVDQDLQAMAAQAPQMAQAMPENQGIGTLPAPNMQNMAGGGIVAFDDGGSPADKINYRQYAIDRAKQLGLNPQLVDNIFKTESGYDPTAKSGTGPVGIGQISKFIGRSIFGQRNGIDPDSVGKANDGRLDPIKNINTSLDFMAHLNQKYKGDPTKISVAYNQGEPVLDKHLKENDGRVVPQDLPSEARKYISKTLTNLMPFAAATAAPTNPAIDQIPGQSVKAPPSKAAPQGIAALTSDPATGFSMPQDVFSPTPDEERKYAAAQAAAKTTGDVVSQIPGQSVKAPAFKDNNTYFGGVADEMGIPQEVQRNVANTLMAPTPMAPVMAIPRAAKSSGLAALGEKIYNKVVPAAGMTEKQIAALRAENEAAKLAQSAQLYPRLTPPAQVLEQGSQVIPVAQTGEATVQSAADLEKVRLANQAADQLAASQAGARTAQEAAKLPSAAERLQQASLLRESDEAARLMARARAATNAKTSLQTGEGLASIAPTDAPYVANTTANKYDSGVMGGAPLPSAEDDIVAALKNKPEEIAAAPEEKTGGMDMNRLMLQMGLHLMAGKSPNALTNVGEAGLGVLGMQQAEAKAQSERESKMSEADYRKAMGKYYEANAASIDRGAKEKNLELEAEKLIAQEISKDKFLNMPGQEAARAAREAQMRATIYRNLGIKPTMVAGAPTGGAKFIGFENPA
jgi:hypothetical protein